MTLNFGSTDRPRSDTEGNSGGTVGGTNGGRLGNTTTCEPTGTVVATTGAVVVVDELPPSPEIDAIQPRDEDTLVKIEKFVPHPAAEPKEVTPAIFRTPAVSTKRGPPLSPLQIAAESDGAIQTKSGLYATLYVHRLLHVPRVTSCNLT